MEDLFSCNIYDRETLRKPLEEKRRSLEGSVYATVPGAQEKLKKLKELELEKQSFLYEIRKRYL